MMIQEIERLNQVLQKRTAENDKLQNDLKVAHKEFEGCKKDLAAMKKELKNAEEQHAKTRHELTDNRKQLEELRKQGEKKQGGSEISKGDRPYRIKLLIDEHLSDMKKELCGMGDLSEREVQEMLSSELESLVDYIQKAIKRNKN